jgi:hypothetical protein
MELHLTVKTPSQIQGNENTDRRGTTDRRKKPTNPFSLRSFKGRRRTVRRTEDRRRHPYVDQYSQRLLLFVILILLLCVADGLFTIHHVYNGARELNPLMDYLLEKGPYVFFGVKYLLFALCLIALVIYRQYPFVRLIMLVLAIVYGAVFLIHIFKIPI